jgi:hypothetical protein
LLAARGTIVSHENVRQRVLKFGQQLRQPDRAEVALRLLTGEGSAALDELRVMLSRAAR